MAQAGRLAVTVLRFDSQTALEASGAHFCIARVGDSLRHQALHRHVAQAGSGPTLLFPLGADQTELELQLHDAALLPGHAHKPSCTSSKLTWLERLDRYVSLLSVGSPLHIPPQLDGVGERPMPETVLASMMNQPSRVGSAFVDLQAARQLWVDEQDIQLRTEGGAKCGLLEVRLLHLPIIHEGPALLKSGLMRWDKCHAELLGNGRLMIYEPCGDWDSRPPEHLLRETLTMESAARPTRCEHGKLGEVGIEMTVLQSTGRPGKKRSRKISLRFGSEQEARTWQKHLQASHKAAKRPMPHLTEDAAESLMERHRRESEEC